MRHRKVLFINLSQFRVLAKNIAIVLLFLLALFSMLVSRMENKTLDNADSLALRVITPAVHIITLPAKGIRFVYDGVWSVMNIYEENKRLKKENFFLLMQKNRYSALRAENILLAKLLKYKVPEEANFVTAQIVSTDGFGFSHSMIAYIGEDEKIKKGQIVLNEKGVVGRVEEIGGNYARILLITDINSRIPVMVERTRSRGILAGDNSLEPKLIFTPLDADIKEDDVIVTSGVAGGFPAGLPIGSVKNVNDMQIKIQPFADIKTLEYVKIIDYGLNIRSLE